MATINIGNSISTPSSSFGNSNLILDATNKANGSGSITSINAYFLYVSATPTFDIWYDNGTSFIKRSSISPGTVSAGYNSFSGLNLDVVANDILGIWCSAGFIGYTSSGSTTYSYYAVNDNSSSILKVFFNTWANRYIMINGVGATAGGKKWNGITITKWNGITISKINAV